MTSSFSSLSLDPGLVQSVSELGYEAPTPIQAAVIPLMLEGRDVIGQAQTGTGKTAAFALPILQGLDPSAGYLQGLVLAPTRELALQVADAIQRYGRHQNTRVLAVYGGQPYSHQINRLKRGVDIVVGTPGRLLDLIRQTALDISRVSSLVLDEADEMLSMGFVGDIEAILELTPPERQTALFSATLPPKIRRLAARYLRHPQTVAIGEERPTATALTQRYYLVNEADKLAALSQIIEVESVTSALAFVRTRLATGELANALCAQGLSAEALNGDLSQDMREKVLDRFRNRQIQVLVATDVAARGLDIEDISHVFNYDLPRDPEVYVHRVGRTGRAGKTGVAISLVSPPDRWRLTRIEGYVKQRLQPATLPSVEEIQAQRDNRLLEQVAVWIRRGRCNREREMAETLVKAGHDPLQIAAIALKMARVEDRKRPIEKIDAPTALKESRPRGPARRPGRRTDGPAAGDSHERGMVRLAFKVGKSDGAQVNLVVAGLAHQANIPGSAIGKISIQERRTLVDIPERFLKQVMRKTGYQIGRTRVSAQLAS
jgi:ATP-dependent RNA helicase DeaD